VSVHASFAAAKKSQTVRRDRESRIGQAAQQLPVMRIEENIVNLIAVFADEMLMLGDERIKVLGAPQGQYLQFTVTHEFLEIPIDRSQTDVRQLPANFQKNLIRSGMGRFVFDGFPDNFQLFGISLLLFQVTVIATVLTRRERRLTNCIALYLDSIPTAPCLCLSTPGSKPCETG
jgi:hypothetical protein